MAFWDRERTQIVRTMEETPRPTLFLLFGEWFGTAQSLDKRICWLVEEGNEGREGIEILEVLGQRLSYKSTYHEAIFIVQYLINRATMNLLLFATGSGIIGISSQHHYRCKKAYDSWYAQRTLVFVVCFITITLGCDIHIPDTEPTSSPF